MPFSFASRQQLKLWLLSVYLPTSNLGILMVSREYLASRHSLCEDEIELPTGRSIEHAMIGEVAGNWFGAAEAFNQCDLLFGEELKAIDRARLLIRSATCFEIAGQHRAAARTYFDAGNLLSEVAGKEQAAGEIFNRSAHCYKLLGEHFSAGTAWMSAARVFEKLGNATVTSHDNILPVPAIAAGLTIAGRCLETAGDAFLKTSGTERNWATMAFWLAGRTYSRSFPSPNISTAWSYKAALENGIRQYKSILTTSTLNYLPLSEEEKNKKVDAVKILERAYYESHQASLKLNPTVDPAETAQLRTDEEMSTILQEFSLLLSSVGQVEEAKHFVILANRKIESIHWQRSNFSKKLLYLCWRMTSNYGHSLQRWTLCTTFMIVLYAIVFFATGSATPADSFWDNLYFSVITFTSLGYGDIQPVGFIGRFFASIEIISGLIFFSILLTFLNNRMDRS